MKTKQTNIQGYSVEIEIEENLTQGWVSKGRFSASIEGLQATGVLCDLDDEMRVPDAIRERIYNWAIANGY